MTKADEYLRYEADVGELAQELEQAVYRRTNDNLRKVFIDFFYKKISPLTEYERVILRNIQNGLPDKTLTIKRFNGELLVSIKETVEMFEMYMFGHLFQFIKERRRIQDKGVTR